MSKGFLTWNFKLTKFFAEHPKFHLRAGKNRSALNLGSYCNGDHLFYIPSICVRNKLQKLRCLVMRNAL